MGFVENFGQAMIQAFLEDAGLRYLRDSDGDFVVEFGYDDQVAGHPRFLLMATGTDRDQYWLRGEILKRVPRGEWDRQIRLCNEWNALYKLPKVYLEVDDFNVSTTGRLLCEQWYNLGPGIHQELVNHLTNTFFTACFGFWRWLERQAALNALSDDLPDPLPDEG